MKRNITKKWILCLSILSIGICSCSDDLSKDEIDAKYAVMNKPSLTVGNVNVVAYNEATVDLSISDVADIAEIGVKISLSEDMSNPSYITTDVKECEMKLSLNQLNSNTTYYAIPYIYLKDGSSVFGTSVTFSTPDVPFTAKMLEGKTFAASNVVDYWGYTWNFSVTIKVDDENPTKVYIYGLFPYAEYNNYYACISKVFGYVNTDEMTISIPSYQAMAPEGLSYFSVAGADIDWTYVDNIIFDIADKGKTITSRGYVTSYYGGYSYDAFYALKLTVQ